MCLSSHVIRASQIINRYYNIIIGFELKFSFIIDKHYKCKLETSSNYFASSLKSNANALSLQQP